jgi:hypothetical protein
MKIINEHTLAVTISNLESKKRKTDISQIKEVVNFTLGLLKEEIQNGNVDGVLELINRQKIITPRNDDKGFVHE